MYQDTNCTLKERESYSDCVRERALNLGSQVTLGMSLLKVKEGTDFEGILSKRFVSLTSMAARFVPGKHHRQI